MVPTCASTRGVAAWGSIILVAALVAACGGQSSSASPSLSPFPSSTTSANASSPAASAAPSAIANAGAVTSPSSAAVTLEQTYEQVVKDVSPSVVLIETPEGLGSGVVLDDEGDIVTNAHVAGTSKSFRVVTSDGTRHTASLVGTFEGDDIAVVKAKDGTLYPATFGNSNQLQVGQIVLAIGNPLGLASSVTDGIVSALGRTVSEPGGAALPGVIQTSAPINPGNSGGALVDLNGDVIGIPTLTASDPQLGGAAVGIGFAIPSNIAKDIATQLVDHGKVVNSHRAYLGVTIADVQGGGGALIYALDPNGPAAKAGIPDDVLITEVDGQPTPDQPTLVAVIAQLQPGQTVAVKFERRDGTTATKQVTLGELPG